MAGTLNGCGTKWIDGVYDEYDLRPRVATKWVVFLDAPILPLRRAVIEPISSASKRHFNRTGVTTEYVILEERWLNLFEIVFTYLWRWCVLAPFWIAFFPLLLVGPAFLTFGLLGFGQGSALVFALGVAVWAVVTVALIVALGKLLLGLVKFESFMLSLTDDARKRFAEVSPTTTMSAAKSA